MKPAKACSPKTMRCTLDHIVLNVTAMPAMIAFYTKVLGLPAERLAEFDAGVVPFPSVRINRATIIDLFPKRLWMQQKRRRTGAPNMNHLCIALSFSQWQRLRARLTARGIPLAEGPVKRWGARGTGVSIYFHDPEANLIEARHYGKSTTKKSCLLGS